MCVKVISLQSFQSSIIKCYHSDDQQSIKIDKLCMNFGMFQEKSESLSLYGCLHICHQHILWLSNVYMGSVWLTYQMGQMVKENPQIRRKKV